ncbi:MAG: HNH endonuclease [Bacteroidales bacterium]
MSVFVFIACCITLVLAISNHWGWFIPSGFLFILGILIAKDDLKRMEREKKERQNLKEVEQQRIKVLEELYKQLFEKITGNYDLKICPKCGENKMNLISISPTGQSIQYECKNCNSKITSKLLPNKKGAECVELLNKIKTTESNKFQMLEPSRFEDNENIFFVKFTNHLDSKDNHRKTITETVRHEIWRRDKGRCVKCGSQINLEFDHIIPVSKGGANTARNIQLLCEKCNRSKSDKI